MLGKKVIIITGPCVESIGEVTNFARTRFGHYWEVTFADGSQEMVSDIEIGPRRGIGTYLATDDEASRFAESNSLRQWINNADDYLANVD